MAKYGMPWPATLLHDIPHGKPRHSPTMANHGTPAMARPTAHRSNPHGDPRKSPRPTLRYASPPPTAYHGDFCGNPHGTSLDIPRRLLWQPPYVIPWKLPRDTAEPPTGYRGKTRDLPRHTAVPPTGCRDILRQEPRRTAVFCGTTALLAAVTQPLPFLAIM